MIQFDVVAGQCIIYYPARNDVLTMERIHYVTMSALPAAKGQCGHGIGLGIGKQDMKIKHLLTAALIVSATVVATAQQTDSTKTSQQTPSRSQQEEGQGSNQFNAKDYTQLQGTDVPANLRTTLKGDEYKGWENGKVYRRNNGEGYYITTGSGNTARNFYFDKSGKATTGTEQGTKPRDN